MVTITLKGRTCHFVNEKMSFKEYYYWYYFHWFCTFVENIPNCKSVEGII